MVEKVALQPHILYTISLYTVKEHTYILVHIISVPMRVSPVLLVSSQSHVGFVDYFKLLLVEAGVAFQGVFTPHICYLWNTPWVQDKPMTK